MTPPTATRRQAGFFAPSDCHTGPAPTALQPPPHLDHPQPIPRQRPRSTRPESLFLLCSPSFLHPSPVATGTSPRHQPHKNARSAPSGIPRQITSAHFAPVTAPFLRLLCHSPSPSAKPVSTVFPSSKYRFAISSALISCSPLFCALMVISC